MSSELKTTISENITSELVRQIQKIIDSHCHDEKACECSNHQMHKMPFINELFNNDNGVRFHIMPDILVSRESKKKFYRMNICIHTIHKSVEEIDEMRDEMDLHGSIIDECMRFHSISEIIKGKSVKGMVQKFLTLFKNYKRCTDCKYPIGEPICGLCFKCAIKTAIKSSDDTECCICRDSVANAKTDCCNQTVCISCKEKSGDSCPFCRS